MAASRTLKLSILADVDQLKKSLGAADKSVGSSADKMRDFGKKAALALAAAGAAAIAFAAKAIQAGEAASTANARIAQINESMGLFGASTDEVTQRLVSYAEATARATGIDTNAIKATQAKLLTFKELAASAGELGGEFDRATQAAIDLGAAGFGTAEMNAVALGKALNDPIKGITALSRSGVTFTEVEQERIRTLVASNKVSEAQILILEAIETQVGGTALATANASDKINVAFSQVQEKIGLALLPTFEKLAAFLIDRVVPAIEAFISGLTGSGGLNKSLTDTQKTAIEWGKKVRGFINTVIDLKDELLLVAKVLATVFVASKIAAGIQATILLVKGLVAAYTALRNSAVAAAIASRFALNPLAGLATGAAVVGAIIAATKLFDNQKKAASMTGSNTVRAESLPSGFTAATPVISKGGSSSSVGGGSNAIAAVVAAATKSPAAKVNIPGGTIPSGFDVAAARRGEERDRVVNNITVNGAIDSEGTARTIVRTINDSFYRGTGGSSQFAI
jgi:hypothetical protein